MIIDMHVHSVSSDDARASAEQYLKWIQVLRNKGFHLDAIVLTEHRKFDLEADYSELSQKYGVLVLKGSEVDTNLGHFLVYGVNKKLLKHVDFADVTMDAERLIHEAQENGALAIPAHPGRTGIGLVNFIEQTGHCPKDIWIVETANGGSRSEENARAVQLAQNMGFVGIGGSDAHFVSSIGSTLTSLPESIQNETELVASLRLEGVRTLLLDETKGNTSCG